MAWSTAWKKHIVQMSVEEEAAAGSISCIECKQKSKITSKKSEYQRAVLTF